MEDIEKIIGSEYPNFKRATNRHRGRFLESHPVINIQNQKVKTITPQKSSRDRIF